MKYRIVLILAALALGVLVMANCHNGDVIPPDSSTITLAATPTTIVLADQPDCSFLGGGKCGTSNVLATVNSPVGVPLSGQDVRFSSTAGILYIGSPDNPQAGLPIRTDSNGNAHIQLITNSSTTVNANSGKATGSLTLSTTTALISKVTLTQDTTSPCSPENTFTTCSDSFCLVATVLDNSQQGIAGLPITFTMSGAVGGVTAQFSQQGQITDASGQVTTDFILGSTSCAGCAGHKCDGVVTVVASTQGGFVSGPLQFNISIP